MKKYLNYLFLSVFLLFIGNIYGLGNKTFKNLGVLGSLFASNINISENATVFGDLTVRGNIFANKFTGPQGPIGPAAPVSFAYFTGLNVATGPAIIQFEGPEYNNPLTFSGSTLTFTNPGYYAVYVSYSDCCTAYFILNSGFVNAGYGSPTPGNKIVGTDFAQSGYFLFQVTSGSSISLYTLDGLSVLSTIGFHYYG